MTESSNGVVILITLLNILVYKLQKLQEAQKANREAEQTNRLPLSLPQLCRRFSLQDIKLATNNFHDELLIGKGGFGMVYKGVIDLKQRVVAIKRLKSTSKQGSKEFYMEIEMLSKFQHSHLVHLVGYCDYCEEMILVYDYMSRGTLADHLHKRVRKGDTSFPPLSWEQRLKICIGAAHGLDYLHTGTSIENRVIHRDVKTTNILLDESLGAKISDFGLSKIGPANQTCTYVSTRVKGTPGYLDPYYISTQRVTSKSDVYAFGVVLFEVLCGRPALDTSLDEDRMNLAGLAQHCSKTGLVSQIIDPNIKVNISFKSLNAYLDIAIKCLHGQPKRRPTMAEIVVGLESALTLQEKSTGYSIVETILPVDYDQDDEDYSMIVNVNSAPNPKMQPSSGMTFTKRVTGLLSVAAQAFSVSRNAKTSKYDTGVLSVKSSKLQAANRHTFLPVHPSVMQTLNQEEAQWSSKLNSFTFNDLKEATRNFCLKSILGEGACGFVYKGWVNESTLAAAKWGTGLVVAIRRLNQRGFLGTQAWLSELNCLETLCHPNLVKLIGYCLEEEHRLIIYEFMPHGSLENHLFQRGTYSLPLSWNLRVSIALGAAKGLAYLHSPEVNVIYRDFKTSNILIDSKYNAKLSDFGFAKDGPEDDRTHVSTTIIGTYGYAAPEYLATGHLTMKSDIYSFGVVLLELWTGRRVCENFLLKKKLNLVSWAKPYLTNKSKNLDVMDARIKGEITVKAASRASSLALKCLSENPKSRPDANQVVKALEQLHDSIFK